MGIYRAAIVGRRKPVLIRADGRNDAKDRIVTTLELLNAEELETALGEGETVWREGTPLPDDEPEPKAEPEKTE
ncbi:MAG: hypothetical protein ACJ8DZ_13840 [Allosphingosinicella sp.]